jgi:hypothetical protein
MLKISDLTVECPGFLFPKYATRKPKFKPNILLGSWTKRIHPIVNRGLSLLGNILTNFKTEFFSLDFLLYKTEHLSVSGLPDTRIHTGKISIQTW